MAEAQKQFCACIGEQCKCSSLFELFVWVCIFCLVNFSCLFFVGWDEQQMRRGPMGHHYSGSDYDKEFEKR